MIIAQVKDNIIVNTIVLDNTASLTPFACDPITKEPYDSLMQIDATYPRPGIGWIFDGLVFNRPPVIEPIIPEEEV